jgi:thiol-disulfide isomerase/thioredoxin
MEPRVAMLKLVTLIVAALALLAVSAGARAGQPFSAKAFQDAQAAGRGILIDVTAPWCPVCKAQRPIIAELEKKNPRLAVFEVDFDTAKDVLRQFGAQKQSTLIVFKGANEVGRSVGDTNAASITAMVAKGL